MMESWRTALAGALFGCALTIAQVGNPTVILDQLRLRDFHMLQSFLTASATSALVLQVFESYGMEKPVRPNSTIHWFSEYDANIIGGAFIGIGMSLSGACPGTLFVQLAQGVPTSIYTMLGALAGGTVWAQFGKTSKGQPATISEKLHVSTGISLVIFEMVCGLAVLLAQQQSYTPVIGGLLIGLAQATSLWLTKSHLGCSAAYEQAGQCIFEACKGTKPSDLPRPTNLIFGLGIVGGSLITSPFLPFSAASLAVPVWKALTGGFLLAIGGRLAGGCTSGHGITGLSAFSLSSLITVSAMFAGGIPFAMLIP